MFASGHCGTVTDRPLSAQSAKVSILSSSPLWTLAASEKSLELRRELSLLLTQKRTQHPFKIRFAVTLMLGTLEAHSSLVMWCLLMWNNLCILLFLSPG